MREQALMHLVRPSGLLKCFAAAALFAGSLVPVANSHAKLAESAEMAETSHTAEEQRNLDAVRTAFAHWEKGTGDFMDILADDARWTIKGSGPDARTFNSRREFQTAMRPFARRLATPITPVLRGLWSDGDMVILNFDSSATAIDGAPYRNSYVWLLKMRDGKAQEVTAYLDLPAYYEVVAKPLKDASPSE